mgnify:CR=1 FL=1
MPVPYSPAINIILPLILFSFIILLIIPNALSKLYEHEVKLDKNLLEAIILKGLMELSDEKDIRRRVKIVNRSVFEKVQTYMINNYGSSTSLTNILKELHKGGMNIKRETLNRYIKILTYFFIIIKYLFYFLKCFYSIIF